MRRYAEVEARALTARERMVRVVAEALGSVVPNSDGVLWDFEHEDGQREPVTLTTAAESVVAALEAQMGLREQTELGEYWLITDWQGDDDDE